MKKLNLLLLTLTITSLAGCSLFEINSSNTTSTSYDTSKDDTSSNTSISTSHGTSTTDTSTGNDTSTSTEIIYQTEEISLSNINYGIIPTSYTSSGVNFKAQNIDLFGNYIVDDYAGGFAIDYIFLKENKGFITNINPINHLKSISFSFLYNNLEVYGSNEFNSNWTQILSNDKTYEFNEEYSYFKISAKDEIAGFENMYIEYESISDSNNNFYNIKDVEEINKTQADSLITITSTAFTNDDYWTNLGYAKNIEQARQNTENGIISGFNQFADYQIEFNKEVIYDFDYTAYRVADMVYGDNGESFRINYLKEGMSGPVIYKDCAYTYIEDIAAYIVAFNDVPPNMQYYKNNSRQAIEDWGIYGRVNYAFYNNDNDKRYFYETELPTHRYLFNPTKNTYDYYYAYYESDYGASVANDEPYQHTSGYTIKPYNDGEFITRGALRFVYTKYLTKAEHDDKNTATITNPYDRNVFYTSTHYNDFQQYLNYYGGWSIRFGNTTLGNPWGEYVEDNHLDAGPYVKITSLENLLK